MSFANVVLADSDKASRGDLANMISERHHTVIEAADGEKALGEFRKLMTQGITPVLVVVEPLAKINGLDLIKSVREEYRANPPIIILTDAKLPKAPADLGIDCLFPKNVHIGDLRNAIYELDSQRASQREWWEDVPSRAISPSGKPSDSSGASDPML